MMRSLKNSAHSLYKRLFKDRTEALIFLTAFIVPMTFGLYLVYSYESTYVLNAIAGGDMRSHIYIPRTVIDNEPFNNLANLGTVWLPLFHLLVMPLTLIDLFYRTGLAGTIVNALLTGGVCVILYRLMGDKIAGIFASFFYVCNVFTWVFGSTTVTQQSAIFFSTLAIYYFKQYWEKNDLREFIKCSLISLLAALTRYEAWIIVLLITLFYAIRELKGQKRYRLAYISLPLMGIFAWFFWNLAIFRDPLMFMNHPRSAQAQAGFVTTPYTGSVWLTFNLVIYALTEISGLLWVLGIFSIIILVFRKKSDVIPMFILSSPILFLGVVWFVGLLGAGSPIRSLKFFYQGYAGIIFSSITILRDFGKRKRIKILIALGIIAVYLPFFFTQSSILAIDPSNSQYLYDDIRITAEMISGNTVLTTNPFSSSLSVIGGISPSSIIDDYDGKFYIKAMEKPWKNCSFVVIDKTKSDSGLIALNNYYEEKFYVYHYYKDSVWKSVFLSHYHLIFETKNFLLFKLVS